MNDKMYSNPAVQRNLKTLRSQGVYFVEPGIGDLACGYKARGRMSEPDEIFRESLFFLNRTEALSGKKIVVSAGRTIEHIDPVRYISNFSSGKTGFRIAEEVSYTGAETVLVAGPSDEICGSRIKRLDVVSAEDMYNKIISESGNADCVIMSAAVADFSPEKSESKIKKSGETFNLKLNKTRDILKELGKIKKKGQILVGFALETDNALENAKKKLKEKNLDMIVLNITNEKNPAFGTEDNHITLITKNDTEEFPTMSKEDIARLIIERISTLLKK
jgi:phosphopantothenoylcysteine decarboxylase / phosphopantothenate---cysteine ligase